MEITQKYADEVRRRLDAGDISGAGAAVAAGYAYAVGSAVSALGNLSIMQKAMQEAMGEDAEAVKAALTSEQVAGLDAIEKRLDDALGRVGR